MMKRSITLCAAMILSLLLCTEAAMDLEELDFAASIDPFAVNMGGTSELGIQIIETSRVVVAGLGSAEKVVGFPEGRLGGYGSVEGLRVDISNGLLLDNLVGSGAVADSWVVMLAVDAELQKHDFVDYAGVVEPGLDMSIILAPEPATMALLGLSSVSLICKKRM